MALARAAAAAELSIARPSPCAIASKLSLRVERVLGQPLASAAALNCTIHVVHEQGALAARLELESPGQASRLRSFRAPTCEKLTDTLTLAVVLAIGASSSASVAAPPAEASRAASGDALDGLAEPSNAAPDAGDSGAPSVQPSVIERAPRVAALAALVADWGTLPALGIGAALGASLGSDTLSVRALGTYLPAREASIQASEAGARGAQVGLLSGALLGCAPRWVAGSRLELGACAGSELGWLRGSGLGQAGPRQSGPREKGALWLAARLDVGGRWALGPPGLGVDVLLSGLVPLARWPLQVSDEVVHRPGVVVGRASLGVSLEL